MDYPIGKVLGGDEAAIRASRERFAGVPVDATLLANDNDTGLPPHRTTLRAASTVTGPGTFYRRARRTLTFMPSTTPGWWIKRTDLRESLPLLVSVRNIWTAQRNIVLRSGSPHNYLRMVEHIVALRLGLGLDDVTIATDAGDPPLFDRGSLDLVEAIERSGLVESAEPARFVTVREPVTIGGDRGDFVTLLPAEPGQRRLRLDCAVDFDSAIGRQRIVFDLTRAAFRHGAAARTNATKWQMLLCKTVGVFFADMRNLGYTRENILIHGKRRYVNEPRLLHNGRSLEAVWHRATLDLLAAIALIDAGRFVGTAISYRAGHLLDTRLMTLLYLHDLLEPAR
ncbi:MAG: UDP-3-O-acyl-N-acetylglucosamine deacetylase [Kiritimatiellae bacterium]|nr:UDP-3-O-acyl-N-acetylglucosamine deacetylase [Kiritimatiellia bacterium]